MTDSELKDKVTAALDANPDLTDHGIGLYQIRRGVWGSYRWGSSQTKEVTADQYEAALKDEHQHMHYIAAQPLEVDRLTQAIDWLNRQKRRKSVNWRIGSTYYLKHVFEDQTGTYISSGMFILAALVSGLTVTREKGSPNPGLNLASTEQIRSHERLTARAENLEGREG